MNPLTRNLSALFRPTVAQRPSLAATTPLHGTEFVLNLVVTVNGPVHTWDHAYEQSLTRDSDIVALLAALPDRACLPEIAHAMA